MLLLFLMNEIEFKNLTNRRQENMNTTTQENIVWNLSVFIENGNLFAHDSEYNYQIEFGTVLNKSLGDYSNLKDFRVIILETGIQISVWNYNENGHWREDYNFTMSWNQSVKLPIENNQIVKIDLSNYQLPWYA